MSQATAEAIVMGASAGALEALTTVLGMLPADFPLAIFVVSHLPPTRDSIMTQLLAAKCRIPVCEAEDKEPIEAGRAYFAPPDYHLLVEPDKRLSLSSEEPVNFARPSIDVLFESAAEAYRESLVGVILTGANKDGAAGLSAVAARGGATVVQRPEEAYAAQMPRAAIEACPSAQVLGLTEIGDYLRKIGARV